MEDSNDDMRPLEPLLGASAQTSSLDDLVKSTEDYFSAYPKISFISHVSRALLFSLVRKHRYTSVAEIGTFFGGTTEVLARAIWENGGGQLHTVDAYNDGRFARAVATWPRPLHDLTSFHPIYSMAFFGLMVSRKVTFDFVLVDANHDFEYALFDLQMAAKLMRPGGIVAMDNCDQTGPHRASKVFLELNAGWSEIGSAIAAYDASKPFDGVRASYPHTTIILLQAPASLTLGEPPQAWERVEALSTVQSLIVKLPAQTTRGVLSYCVTLRGFVEQGTGNTEVRIKGSMALEVVGAEITVRHTLPAPLVSRLPSPGYHKVEIELSWQGTAPLLLEEPPTASDIAYS